MEKIKKLKKIFKKEKIDGYIIPKNDEFFEEYTPKFNDRLNFISGFTGSYGFALVLKNKWPMSCVNPTVLPRAELERWQPYPMNRGPNR